MFIYRSLVVFLVYAKVLLFCALEQMAAVVSEWDGKNKQRTWCVGCLCL